MSKLASQKPSPPRKPPVANPKACAESGQPGVRYGAKHGELKHGSSTVPKG